MNDISVNMLIKSSEDEHIWRILWISGDQGYAYVFNTTTLEMPSYMLCTDLLNQIEEGSFVPQQSDPYIVSVA